jgi:hypothetical protein
MDEDVKELVKRFRRRFQALEMRVSGLEEEVEGLRGDIARVEAEREGTASEQIGR